jgi:hypothetical protein
MTAFGVEDTPAGMEGGIITASPTIPVPVGGARANTQLDCQLLSVVRSPHTWGPWCRTGPVRRV